MKNISAEDFEDLLTELHACHEAKLWAKGKDLAEIWSTCERGDWMLWLLGNMQDKPGWLTHKQVTSIVCDCVEPALKYVKPGETRPAECLAVVRKWIKGEATIEEVEKAKEAAYAAAANAFYAASDAAYAAAVAYAADAAVAAASDASYAASDAASAAASAAAYAAASDAAEANAAVAAEANAAVAAVAEANAAAKKESLRFSADICRKAVTIE